MQNRRGQFGGGLAWVIADRLWWAISALAVKSSRPQSSVNRRERLLRWSDVPRLRQGLSHSLWLSLALILLLLGTPHQGHALPNPIEGTLGGGRVATGAAPEGVLSAGYFHSCSVKSDGTLACWGDNAHGQLNNIPVGTFSQVSGGAGHTCGVRSDGTLACWGDNFAGQATPPSGTFSQVSAGGYHTCGLKSDGTLMCWGASNSGQLNNIPSGIFSQVSAGGYHTCGLKSDGTLACWGDNFYGQLNNIPVGTFSQVSGGALHTCSLRSDGTLACWGDNTYGQLDNIPAGTFSQISAGGFHTCGVRSDGTLTCWGDNTYGQLNDLPAGTFSQVSTGWFHTCGLRSDGTLICLGNNDYGQLTNIPTGIFNRRAVRAGYFHTCGLKSNSTLACWGDNTYGQATPPSGIFSQVSAGYFHSCSLKSDGTLVCWGDNAHGQLNNIPSGTFSQMSGGVGHTCAVRSDGTLACWGDNFAGQATPPSGTFSQVSAGGYHTCGLKSDGTLMCWGANNAGQLNNIPAGTFSQISAGGYHTCGLKSDGTLACWGDNTYGQLNDLPSGTFNQISAGALHTCSLRSDGTLACWGDNTYGQLDNIPGGIFSQVSGGGFHACGVRSDGTLTCWGENDHGQAPALSLNPSSLGNGSVGSAYSQSLSLTDAVYTPPVPQDFRLVAGSLPPGLTLTAVGLLSGTPTSSGAFFFTVRGEDDNGFTATQNYTLSIGADATPPSITPTVSGTVGNNGWYTSTVSVSWSVVDNESAVTMQVGCDPQTVATDTTGRTFTCQATSAGGTASQSVTIKRDATAPILSPTVSPNPVLLNGAATASPGASDTTSGLASASCETVTTSSVGSFTVTCTATDNAGNVANTPASYLVTYQFPGFISPLPQESYKAGATIRVKFRLADASGTPLSDAAAQGLVAACRVKVGLDTAAGCASYDAKNDIFQFDVKVPKNTSAGTHQIVVQVLASDNSMVNTATTAVLIR